MLVFKSHKLSRQKCHIASSSLLLSTPAYSYSRSWEGCSQSQHALGGRKENTLDRLPVHHRARQTITVLFTPMGNLARQFHLTSMPLNCRKKSTLTYGKQAHSTEKKAKTTNKLRTFLRCGHRANH